MKIIAVDASTKEQRTSIASLGIAIEEVHANYIVGLALDSQINDLREAGFSVSVTTLPAFLEDFPIEDSAFHNLDELNFELQTIAENYSEIASLKIIGKSLEKRPLYIMRIGGMPERGKDAQGEMVPGIIFLGTHHAREHLSTEVPLFLIKYLVENYGKIPSVTELVNTREIWIMPMVNPDGSTYDVDGESPYKWWRKNRRMDENGNIYGVDLNRNYGYKWGGEGSSSNKKSDTYRGGSPFSEPETQAVKTFIEAHDNITLLLTYHTFSELILYPWGHTYENIENQRDLKVHELLAGEMGRMTGYKPQKSSELYLTSGDTTDWAYGEKGIISFTFELYPDSLIKGGFYPSAAHIQEVVKNNIPTALYLANYADNPYRILETPLQIGKGKQQLSWFSVR